MIGCRIYYGLIILTGSVSVFNEAMKPDFTVQNAVCASVIVLSVIVGAMYFGLMAKLICDIVKNSRNMPNNSVIVPPLDRNNRSGHTVYQGKKKTQNNEIYVIPRVCLIRKYGSQIWAFFSVFQYFSGCE